MLLRYPVHALCIITKFKGYTNSKLSLSSWKKQCQPSFVSSLPFPSINKKQHVFEYLQISHIFSIWKQKTKNMETRLPNNLKDFGSYCGVLCIKLAHLWGVK